MAFTCRRKSTASRGVGFEVFVPGIGRTLKWSAVDDEDELSPDDGRVGGEPEVAVDVVDPAVESCESSVSNRSGGTVARKVFCRLVHLFGTVTFRFTGCC